MDLPTGERCSAEKINPQIKFFQKENIQFVFLLGNFYYFSCNANVNRLDIDDRA